MSQLQPTARQIQLEDLYKLRGEVFASDSKDGIVHLEQDLLPTTMHLGIFIGNMAVAGGSLVIEEFAGEKAFRIRAVAVSPAHQGKGFGALLLESLLAQAALLGKHERTSVVWLSSLIDQVGFYSKFGFTPAGEPYLRPVDGWSQLMSLRLP